MKYPWTLVFKQIKIWIIKNSPKSSWWTDNGVDNCCVHTWIKDCARILSSFARGLRGLTVVLSPHGLSLFNSLLLPDFSIYFVVSVLFSSNVGNLFRVRNGGLRVHSALTLEVQNHRTVVVVFELVLRYILPGFVLFYRSCICATHFLFLIKLLFSKFNFLKICF